MCWNGPTCIQVHPFHNEREVASNAQLLQFPLALEPNIAPSAFTASSLECSTGKELSGCALCRRLGRPGGAPPRPTLQQARVFGGTPDVHGAILAGGSQNSSVRGKGD